ncbi:TadE/TadG family type IV pilus assembly protein [Pyxidicoccus caerfyrddinensis]|uniref:TadE/TadG family type IV pilus assembly protein n=1 Tax=Pyxidicoccus caerfyrddinensis TaxID=2709663 RepID=UPI003B8384F6
MRARRGQAMVLSALSFLVLALMVTLSFNLSHALRQKMSLQQHSDALAYSMAVLEARALNYYAVGNRAIAGSYVAMNSIHAYVAAASVSGEMMRAARNNFFQIAALEVIRCMCYTCIEHCIHAAEAVKIAGDFSKEGSDYDKLVRGGETSFVDAMKGLDLMVDNLHIAQRSVHDKTLQSVKDGKSNGLEQLTEYNAPGATFLAQQVGGMNANEFNCAVDGMDCQGSVASTSPEARARAMTEVANASRSGWPATRETGGIPSIQIPAYLHSDFMDKFEDIPDEGNYQVLRHVGTAKTVQDHGEVNGPGQQGGNSGLVVAASEEGMIFHKWKHGIGMSPYKAEVWSDEGNGGHEPSGAHSGQHPFEGVNAKALTACSQSGNCFMKFRANPSPARDWGQPRVYSYVTKQFRGGDPKKTPWELNSSATLEFRHGAQGSGRLTLSADEGVGLSKALVYYHRFGDNGWREPPNLFGPYWRAKLHPFRDGDEAGRVLEAAGNQDAADLARVPGVSL